MYQMKKRRKNCLQVDVERIEKTETVVVGWGQHVPRLDEQSKRKVEKNEGDKCFATSPGRKRRNEEREGECVGRRL